MQSTQQGLALLKHRAHLGATCRLTMDRLIGRSWLKDRR